MQEHMQSNFYQFYAWTASLIWTCEVFQVFST